MRESHEAVLLKEPTKSHTKFGDTTKRKDLRPGCPPIFNQGNNDCTANAGVGMLEFVQLKEIAAKLFGMPEEFGVDFVPLSRRFFYYAEREIEHDTKKDEGATSEDVATVCLKKGICPESMWPYTKADLKEKPTPECYAVAAKHKAKEVYAIEDGSLHEMKLCILQGFVFTGGIDVYESFMTDAVAKTGIVPMPDTDNEQVEGGHEILFVGFDDEREVMIFANSWGTAWGDQGFGYLPYKYITDPDLASGFRTARY